MSKRNYKQDVTYNYASSLGAAIRNSLTKDVQDDPNTAGERLNSLLTRMQELEQFDAETVTGVLISMLHQMGELHAVADYCAENGETNIEVAKKVYKRYAEALKAGDETAACKHARVYNFYLKQAGGPTDNPAESYLEMGV